MLRIPTAPPTHAPYYFHKGNGKSMVIRRSRSPWMNGIKEGSDRDFVDDEPLPFAKPPKDLANLQPLEAVELLPPVLRRGAYSSSRRALNLGCRYSTFGSFQCLRWSARLLQGALFNCAKLYASPNPRLSEGIHSLDVTNRIRQTTKFCAIGIGGCWKIPINLETPIHHGQTKVYLFKPKYIWPSYFAKYTLAQSSMP